MHNRTHQYNMIDKVMIGRTEITSEIGKSSYDNFREKNIGICKKRR